MNKSRKPFFIFAILVVAGATALSSIVFGALWNNAKLKEAEDGKLVELSGASAYEAAKSLVEVSLPPISDEFHFAKQGVPSAYRFQFGAQPNDAQAFLKRLGIDNQIRETGTNCSQYFHGQISMDVSWWDLKNVQSCSIGFYRSERQYYTILLDQTFNIYWKVYVEII